MSGCMILKQKEAIKQQNSNFKSMCFKKKDRCNVLAIKNLTSAVVRFLFSFLHLLTSMNILCSHRTLMLLYVRD